MEKKIKLIEKDYALLKELDLNAREKITTIARHIGISKELALYRIRRLEELGVIKGYKPVINHYYIGRNSFHVYLSLSRKDLEYRINIQEELMNLKGVKRVLHAYGKWDFIITFHSKNMKEFKESYEEMFNKYDKYITDKWISFITKTIILPKRRFYPMLAEKIPKKLEFGLTDLRYELREEETRILRELVNNSRQTLIELSQKTGMSTPTVKRILENLEKSGVIIGYYADYNPEVFDLDHYKLLIRVDEFEALKPLQQYLELQPEVIQIQLPLGSRDMEIEVYVDSLDELEKFIGGMTTHTTHIRGIDIIPIMSETRVFLD
ncbi:Lrp/AsnC family transcriptional regulator [Candidatus Woesearchaeota archaeon]|nr:Lrp/AsnC family transcriptional regulator [Candidatus Woesearchaeota archaeon]